MKKAIVLALSLFFISCNDTEKMEQIVGEWKCASWISESTGNDKCQNNVSFKFNADKTYSSVLGSAKDNGQYKISEGTLYSTPEGKMEIGVEINKLSQDTLQFIMSQSGEKEVLTLLRQ